MAFSDRLKQFREGIGLSQPEMAAKLGVKLETYRTYEHGRSEPKYEILQQISLLGANLHFLLTGGGDSASQSEAESKRKTMLETFEVEVNRIARELQKMKQEKAEEGDTSTRVYKIAGADVVLPINSETDAKALVDLGRLCAAQILHEMQLQGRTDLDSVDTSALIFKWFEYCLRLQVRGENRVIEKIVSQNKILQEIKKQA